MNNVSRRRFLKIAGAGAGAAAAGSSLAAVPGLRASAGSSEKGIRQVPTFCDICFWKCGAIATVRDGRLWKIEGNPEDPLSRGRLCPRGTGGVGAHFDPDRLRQHVDEAAAALLKAKALYEGACADAGQTPENLSGPVAWQPAGDLAGLVRQGEEVGIADRRTALGDDVSGLQELILYGLKGAAAYMDHALILGRDDPPASLTGPHAHLVARELPAEPLRYRRRRRLRARLGVHGLSGAPLCQREAHGGSLLTAIINGLQVGEWPRPVVRVVLPPDNSSRSVDLQNRPASVVVACIGCSGPRAGA